MLVSLVTHGLQALVLSAFSYRVMRARLGLSLTLQSKRSEIDKKAKNENNDLQKQVTEEKNEQEV